MKKKLLLLILMLLPNFISSCSDDDGEVTPMKWKTEVKGNAARDGYIHLSPEGDTFVFQCTNYSDFWITSVTEQEAGGEERKFNPELMDTEDLCITSNWLTAKREGNKLTVTISPTTSNGNRFMKVYVQNGDAFYEFKFKQRGLKVGL